MTERERLIEDWTRQADRWLEPPAPGTVDPLPVLDHLADGIVLRRRLDHRAVAFDRQRERLVATATRLEHAAVDLLEPVRRRAEQVPGAVSGPVRTRVAEHVDRLLAELAAFQGLMFSDAALTPAHRALLATTLRFDLHWAGVLVDWLEQDLPIESDATLRVSLHQIEALLERPEQDADRQSAKLLESCRWLRLELITRQLAEELRRPTERDSVVELWHRRLAVSSVHAEFAAAPHDAPELALATTDELENLAAHRRRLGELAEERSARLDAAEAVAAWEEVVLAAHGHSNEIVTLLGEMSLARSTHALRLAEADLRSIRASVADLARRGDLTQVQRLRLPPLGRRIKRLVKRARNEAQEKHLQLRLNRLLGRRVASALELLILVLILAITALIVTEMTWEYRGTLTHEANRWFAYADLGICSVFLGEFFLRLSLVRGKWLYLMRHFVVDFLASIPFGFLTFATATGGAYATTAQLARLPRLARALKLIRPVMRLGRLVAFAMKATDQLVRRYANLFNRNIVLFEPAESMAPQLRSHHRLTGIRRRFNGRTADVLAELDEGDRRLLAGWVLQDLQARARHTRPASLTKTVTQAAEARTIPVEAVVGRLSELTPEEVVEVVGQPFARSVARWVRLFDVPGVRRLPVVRTLVAQQKEGAAETTAAAANFLGRLLQGGLDAIYYLADFAGTISAPIFVDRLGTMLVSYTARPAKQLLMFGGLIAVPWLLIQMLELVGIATPSGVGERFTGWFQKYLGLPVVIVGLVCLTVMLLGTWLKRIANQASEFSERVVEAQFAAQTKALKQEQATLDHRFLLERVVDPELALRSSDDVEQTQGPALDGGRADLLDDPPPDQTAEERDEHLFLHNVRLLYRDYLDGSLFHRNDVRTTTQLLGNLALSNLRLSDMAFARREEKLLRKLDLSRSGSLLGGPYLWFNYITRLITTQTARLLVDYNRNAVPLRRLACAPRQVRDDYRDWLARRLGVPAAEIELPAPVGLGDADEPAPADRHPKAAEFFVTVDFTAMDFLAGRPRRDCELREKYGAQVVRLLAEDRCRNIRRAFRSFPLHQVPPAQRTVNVFSLYESYVSRMQVLFMPFRLLLWSFHLLRLAAARMVGLVRDLLAQRVEATTDDRPESYAVAQRKIHRMRKPLFMGSLWLRARLDPEYLGLPLPGVPRTLAGSSLLETDLDFIGASRRDRQQAETLHRRQRDRLRHVRHWLADVGFGDDDLTPWLRTNYPYLTDRATEVHRAVALAVLLDHDDLYTLGSAFWGLQRIADHAVGVRGGELAAADLPDPAGPPKHRWYAVRRQGDWPTRLFALAGFDRFSGDERLAVAAAVRERSRLAAGWTDVLLSQGGDDPLETFRRRLRSVVRKTDLWSDEIVTLRTVQTLTMLDVHHYCEMVWKLGGYAAWSPATALNELPLREEAPTPASDRPALSPLPLGEG